MMLRGSQDTNTMTERNRTVRRISVNVRMAVSTTAGLQLPDLTAVQLKCTLYRGGKSFDIFQDSLRTLAIESMFFNCLDPVLHPSYLMNMVSSPVTLMSCPIIIDLASPINLKGDDYLELEATCNSSWLTGPAVSVSANSTIEFVFREEIGVETFIPQIRSKYIQGGIAKITETLGDNITSLAFINTDPIVVALTDANAILQQVTITSDRYNINDTLDRCIARRQTQFQHQFSATLRGNSFVWDFSGKVDRLKFDANVNPANVNASKNVLVWRTYIVHRDTIRRAAEMEAKHNAQNAAQLAKQAA